MNRFILISFLSIIVAFAQAQDTIQWSPNYKLKWEDFQRVPPPVSTYGAITSATIKYKLLYSDTSFSYKISCYFLKTKSWAKSHDSIGLMHEQGHFDISEIFARKLDILFRKYRFSKRIKENFYKDYLSIIAERTKMNNQYDKETDFSMNKKMQLYWSDKIAKELKLLDWIVQK